MARSASLFDDARLSLEHALDLTAQAVNVYANESRHWVVTYSGGKDSTTALTVLHWLIETGRVPRPESLTALFADTRMELPPLHATAMNLLGYLRERGVVTKIVQPTLDKRFFVYMLGRGVPPPGVRFRWCTGGMKLDPMNQAVQALAQEHGRILVTTGVRLGESAARDQRIALACGRDDTECGQGYFQRDINAGQADMLAPIIHWRVCHVWDWLMGLTPESHGYPTEFLAEAYGGDEARETEARTGCVGCPVAARDKALEAVIQQPRWAHLTPLMELRALWPELRAPQHRIRKHGERKKDGSLKGGGDRMGPLTFEARLMGLARVLDIQERCNAHRPAGVPAFTLIDAEEEARIRELIAAGTWPQGWDGTEARADEFMFRTDLAEGGQFPLLGLN